VKQTQTRPFKTTPDFRRVVEDRRVQAVVIAAPHHVHAPAAVAALKANKHVYLEQPVSHNAREGEMILDALRRGKSIFQAGLQRRSVPWIAQVIRRVQQDEFGRVRFARAWYTDRRESLGFGQLAPVPADLDFLLWQGPAPDRPYRDNLIPGNWRWFWHWGTGELGAQGVPWLDLARWGLQVDCPTRVASSGGRYHFEDDQETPDTQVVTYDFGDRSLVWEHRSCQSTPSEGEPYGVAFYGAKATLVLGPKGYRLLDLAGKETEAVAGEVPTTPHVANFIECFTNRARTPAANAEDAHKSCLLAHLGNLAQRAGETVFLNPKTLQLREPKPAMARLWSREYRPGWNPAA
jgi:predicted dehydrogenase